MLLCASSKMCSSGPPCGKALHRPTGVSLSKKKKWTLAAASDLQKISNYLKEHHPNYRQPTMQKLYDTIRALKEWPNRGRPGREEGTR
jgi:hypothetical protein